MPIIRATEEEENPPPGGRVLVELRGIKYVVVRSEVEEEAEHCLHVWPWSGVDDEPDTTGQELGRVRILSRWGWSFSPTLAVAFVTRKDFITPDEGCCGLYGAFTSSNSGRCLQWVDTPVAPNDGLLLLRATENSVTASVVLKLVECGAKGSNKKARSQCLRWLPRLREAEWTVNR